MSYLHHCLLTRCRKHAFSIVRLSFSPPYHFPSPSALLSYRYLPTVDSLVFNLKNFYFSSSSLFVHCPSGKTCSHFSADRDSRSQLHPAKCTQEGQNKYEDTCKVVCNHGNVLNKPAAEITTCGKDGLWVPYPSYCIGKGGEVALTQEMI